MKNGLFIILGCFIFAGCTTSDVIDAPYDTVVGAVQQSDPTGAYSFKIASSTPGERTRFVRNRIGSDIGIEDPQTTIITVKKLTSAKTQVDVIINEDTMMGPERDAYEEWELLRTIRTAVEEEQSRNKALLREAESKPSPDIE